MQTDIKHGIDSKAGGDASIEGRKEAYGANTIRYAPPKSFFGILFEQLRDPTLMLLMFAASVSWCSSAYRNSCWLAIPSHSNGKIVLIAGCNARAFCVEFVVFDTLLLARPPAEIIIRH